MGNFIQIVQFMMRDSAIREGLCRPYTWTEDASYDEISHSESEHAWSPTSIKNVPSGLALLLH
jgi:hypothetical protein